MTELDELAVSRAGEVYERTRRLANGNMWVQGASGVFGSGLNLVVDAVLIPFYAELWNDVRNVYGKGRITADVVGEGHRWPGGRSADQDVAGAGEGGLPGDVGRVRVQGTGP